MSVPSLISPLLDGFVMGDAISCHDGVRCCPAMRVSDEHKYIVKIISVPASQTKLDALLLAGAFLDRESALSYFNELSQDVVEEAVLLQRFSRLEGFLSYEGWQVVPMEDGTGYDVYLLAPYRPTLERSWSKNGLTHLQAVNLGLDLCSALAACRRSGYLYVDLKPENVCLFTDNEYRISDIGFVNLSSLNYASLPDRYRSAYTAPEITDAYSALNDTMDTYAAGLILYQAYNEGALPEIAGDGQSFRAPRYADTQMAQIILKACASDPSQRWQDPVEMGQALVSYMQTSSVNDTPIVPVPEEAPELPEEALELPEEEELRTEDVLAEADLALEAAAVFPAETLQEETETPAEVPDEETVTESTEEVTEEPAEESTAPAEVAADIEAPTEPETEESAEEVTEEPIEETSEDTVIDEETSEENATEEILPEEGSADWEEALVAEAADSILEQADALIAHELPEPPVAPEPIEIPIPAPIVLAPETEEEPAAEVPEEVTEESPEEPEEISEETPEEVLEEEAEEPYEEEEEVPPVKKKRGGLIALIVILLLLAAGCVAGWFYYNNYYLQPILGMQLKGAEDRLTITLNTQTDNSLLTVYCTDTYGNTQRLPVENNTVTFTGLSPNTHYKIHVEIDGFHELIGTTSDTYTTAEQTVISGFTAVTGDTSGSAILNFTIQGPETSNWKVIYSCPGEAEKEITFTGHMVIVNGLTAGKTYTFRLEPTSALYVVGEETLEFTASELIFAEGLTIESFLNGSLTAVWKAPEGITVNSWTVRCSSDTGFSKSIVVSDPVAVFDGLDPAAAYTVQVTAEGMTVGTNTFITANTVTIENIRVDESIPGQITLNWDFQGTAPEAGWLVLYTATGYPEQQVVKTTNASAIIAPVIPGMEFSFTIQSASGSTVFGGTAQHKLPDAESFAGYMLTAADLTFRMCRTPAVEAWSAADVPQTDYVNTFAPGENASLAITVGKVYGISEDNIRTLAVIRDESGNVVDTLTLTRTWSSMWYKNFGKLDLFALPQNAGNYTVEVYFNEALVTTQNFTIA